MASFKLEIGMENDAFAVCSGAETARILRFLADEIEFFELEAGNYSKVRDANGNAVGTWSVS